MAQHSLAAVVYDVVTNHREDLARRLGNLAIDIRRAVTGGERYELPRLAKLLERPDFAALRQVLADREVNLGKLQGTIDALVDQVRSQVEAAG